MRLPNGIWVSTANPSRFEGKPGLILDRDGVIIREEHYLCDPAKVALMPGLGPLMAWARARAMALCCATNQSGIARGLISWPEFEAVEAEITSQLKRLGQHLDITVACPFHPDFPGANATDEARWRKPGPAMIEWISARTGIDPARSWLIGDKASDIEAARAGGLKGAIHVATGHGQAERNALGKSAGSFKLLLADDLAQALAQLQVECRQI